jgi:L,D-peptidoglycan transpeptidase YkuD (ErfK/YbiS/YcfS/YnhG family)
MLGVVGLALGAQSTGVSREPRGAATDVTPSGLSDQIAAAATPDLTRLRPEFPRGYHASARDAAPPAAAEDGARAEPSPAAAGPSEPAATTTAAPAPPPQPPAAPAGGVLPLGLAPERSSQVVTVVAPSAGATRAQLTAWQRGPTGWTAVLGPVTARVGSAGVGQASETSTRTPAGTFTLSEAFGRSGNPGTALPYRVIDTQDWWVSDVASPLYNQHTRCAPGSCPFDESAGENLWAEGSVYDLAVVIDYNRGGTPGAGSAFFLHVSNGAPTAGCVAIDRGSLAALMRWLTPGARPLIAIGVG